MSIDEHESQLDQLEMQNVRETLKSDQYYSPSSGSYCAPPSSSSSPSSSASISAAMTVVNVRDLNHNGGNVGRGPVSAFDRGENSDEEIHDIPLDFDRHAIERSKKTEVERFYTSVNRCLRIDIALLWCALALGTSCLFALGALTTDSEVFYYYKKLTGDGDPGGFMEAGLSKMTVYTAVNGRPPRDIQTTLCSPYEFFLTSADGTAHVFLSARERCSILVASTTFLTISFVVGTIILGFTLLTLTLAIVMAMCCVQTRESGIRGNPLNVKQLHSLEKVRAASICAGLFSRLPFEATMTSADDDLAQRNAHRKDLVPLTVFSAPYHPHFVALRMWNSIYMALYALAAFAAIIGSVALRVWRDAQAQTYYTGTAVVSIDAATILLVIVVVILGLRARVLRPPQYLQ